ncbi:hypothetical protein ACLBVB_28850, partial [Pseudomonas aeruginosa]
MSHDLLLNLKDLACGYASQKVVQDLDLHTLETTHLHATRGLYENHP